MQLLVALYMILILHSRTLSCPVSPVMSSWGCFVFLVVGELTSRICILHFTLLSPLSTETRAGEVRRGASLILLRRSLLLYALTSIIAMVIYRRYHLHYFSPSPSLSFSLHLCLSLSNRSWPYRKEYRKEQPCKKGKFREIVWHMRVMDDHWSREGVRWVLKNSARILELHISCNKHLPKAYAYLFAFVFKRIILIPYICKIKFSKVEVSLARGMSFKARQHDHISSRKV